MTALFNFTNPNALLKKATKASATRRSGTVAETVRHSLIHTQMPDVTLHHAIIAACPHPLKTQADQGEYYMVAYVSIPLPWLPFIDAIIRNQWDVSFIGPAGTTQHLPPSMRDMDDVLGDRVYIGFDWFWLTQSQPPIQQPHYDKIKPKLIQFVSHVRQLHESF